MRFFVFCSAPFWLIWYGMIASAPASGSCGPGDFGFQKTSACDTSRCYQLHSFVYVLEYLADFFVTSLSLFCPTFLSSLSALPTTVFWFRCLTSLFMACVCIGSVSLAFYAGCLNITHTRNFNVCLVPVTIMWSVCGALSPSSSIFLERFPFSFLIIINNAFLLI